uniref:Uncharacterized protein n=1 Tax=Tetraselmis sp. GSL018 TaxID=582737 RepID=A0A061S7T5_9CHLO
MASSCFTPSCKLRVQVKENSNQAAENP